MITLLITKTDDLKSKQLKLAKFYCVTKTLEIELGGANEKISGKCKPHVDVKSAEREATELLLKEFFEKCCLSKKMGNILVDVLNRPIK